MTIKMTGTYGSLTIIGRDPKSPGGSEVRWLCSCECGRTVSRYGTTLRSGETTSCGCRTVQGRRSAVWDGAALEKLRRLWDQGLSTAAIGLAMGVSKNTIVGKAHRLHLAARPSPIIRSDGPKPVPSIPRDRPRDTLPAFEAPVFVAPPAPVPAVRPAFVAPPVPAASMPSFAPLSARRCEWLVGDRPRGFVRCEHPVARGAFCQAHAAIAYVPRRVREEVA